MDTNTPQPADPVTPESSEDVYVFPTTVGQRRFWLLDQLKPGNPALNVPLAARIEGPLNLAAMEAAVNGLIARHEILRTTYRVHEDEVVQVIHRSQTVPVVFEDIGQIPESGRDAEVQRLMVAEGERSFDLARGPMLRARVVRLADAEHVIMLTMHHVAGDGWSNGVVMREIAQLYTSELKGGALEDLPLQYADFAHWQKEWLQSPEALQQQAYWRERLKGTLPVMNVPNDRPRRTGRSFPSAIHTLLLPRELSGDIKELCAREDVTPFMVFLAVYGILVHRYTGNPDVVIASPAANRNQTELEGLIGLFSNPLVLRLDFSGNPTVRMILLQVKEVSLGALANQSFPFETLVDGIKSDPDRAGLPWLQVYFVFQKAFMVPQELPEGSLVPLRSVSPGATLEWSLGVLERAEGTRLQMEYNTELHHESTIERLLRQFQWVLERLRSGLATPVGRLSILSPEQQKFFLGQWNRPGAGSPTERLAHELFEEQARLRPDAPALESDGRQLSYRELNTICNRVAASLRKLGAGPGSRVGLAIPLATPPGVVGLLGILKSGACCAVLESPRAFPDATEGLVAILAAPGVTMPELPVLHLPEGIQGPDPGEPLPDFPRIVLPEQPAIFSRYTSPHQEDTRAEFSQQALASGVSAVVEEIGLKTSDRVILSPELVLPALASGACLVERTMEGGFDSAGWISWVQGRSVTVGAVSLAAWHDIAATLADNPPPRGPMPRCLMVGAGRLSAPACAAWWASSGGSTRLLLGYRPRAALFPSGFHEVLPGNSSPRGVCVSRPAANCRLYVLDTNLQPVPPGVPGEIYVGGDAAPIGALPDPFSGRPGGGIFATGDLGRFVDDKGMELVARLGDIAGLRRFRLEIRDILTVLGDHPGVWNAIVLSSGQTGDRPGLDVHVVCRSDAPPSGKELLAHLSSQLPVYMMPESLTVHTKLPLGPDGRIDRMALSVSREAPLVQDNPGDVPTTDMERVLVGIWEELLGRRPIGVMDNFFALGGQSLAAVRLFAQLHKVTGRHLPMVTLFEAPTIKGLARIIEEGRESSWSSLVSIKSTGSMPPFYCVHGVGGNILEFEHFSRYIEEDQPLYGIQAQGLDGKSQPHESVEEMAAHYIKEVRGFQPGGPYYLGGSSFGGMVALEMARQLRSQGERVGLLVMFDTWAPGYPVYLPSARSWRKHLYFWRSRVKLHWEDFWLCEGGQRLEYLKSKTFRLLHRASKPVRMAAKKWKQESHPEEIRLVRESGRGARKSYMPGVYDGDVTLLRAIDQPLGIVEDRTNGWTPFVRGRIDVHDIPGAHGSMMRDPRARVLVENLTKCLREAQGLPAAGRPPSR